MKICLQVTCASHPAPSIALISSDRLSLNDHPLLSANVFTSSNFNLFFNLCGNSADHAMILTAMLCVGHMCCTML